MDDQPTVQQLAEYLEGHDVEVVGVQQVRHALLGGGDAITLTGRGARQLARQLGHPTHDGAAADVALTRALHANEIDDVTVAVEYQNIRLGKVSPDAVTKLMSLHATT